jgi:SAM-dependent methyltransferase
MKLDYINFPQRADRSRYIARRFAGYLRNSVLDVGCDKAVLRGLLVQNVAYTGIDIGGTPDMVVNLEQTERLPFDDDAFSCCVCSDVLEHLDNIHAVFGELVRVSRDHIVVSLPNNWANARRPIERGKGSIAHYGLPAVRPPDRHKWFFGFTEAVEFLHAQEQWFPVSIIETVANEKPRLALVRAWRHMRYPVRERYLNRYAHTVWVVFEKRAGRG